MPQPLLSVKNLTIAFEHEGKEIVAVNNCSFDLLRGETIGIVGESGSGKSVTSLAIMGLLPAHKARIKSGEILFDHNNQQRNLLTASKEDLRNLRGNRIAMIFQEPMTSLNPVYTCGDQIVESLRLHAGLSGKEAKKRTIELFEEVLIPRPEKIFDSYPYQLSGGQRQRVMIAMAIALRPDLLIADEPTTALDVTVQKTILELLADLQKQYQMSMIFITHDLGVVAQVAHKTMVMYRGNTMETKPTSELLHHPENAYTKALLACRPSIDAKPFKLPTISDFMEEMGDVKAEKTFVDFKPDYNTEPILKVENLNTWFEADNKLFSFKKNHVKAVNNVSFEVFEGETLGLVGESGCGKSTLGRTILGLIEAKSGSVKYKGLDLQKISKKEMRHLRQKISIVFQDPYSSLNPHFTIGDAISEPMLVHKIFNKTSLCKQKTIELLKKVGLSEEHYHRYPHEFSGGQRQRVVIARALALNPDFVICDESVSALDVSVQAQVLNLLNDLKREFKFTVIFISHDLSVVKYMSDRIVVMNKGEIEEMGFPEDIFRSPKSDYTRRLIDAIPVIG